MLDYQRVNKTLVLERCRNLQLLSHITPSSTEKSPRVPPWVHSECPGAAERHRPKLPPATESQHHQDLCQVDPVGAWGTKVTKDWKRWFGLFGQVYWGWRSSTGTMMKTIDARIQSASDGKILMPRKSPDKKNIPRLRFPKTWTWRTRRGTVRPSSGSSCLALGRFSRFSKASLQTADLDQISPSKMAAHPFKQIHPPIAKHKKSFFYTKFLSKSPHLPFTSNSSKLLYIATPKKVPKNSSAHKWIWSDFINFYDFINQ